MTSRDTHRGLSRRQLIKGAVGGAMAIAGGRISVGVPQAAPPNPAQNLASTDYILTNGTFVDGRGIGGTAMTVKNGRIVGVGQPQPPSPGAQTIDLGGRTVIPGLFDAHVHYTRAGINPGHEARRIERAFSIAELQEAIARVAAAVPAGEFITCIGGWNHTQFAESRRPTKAELDDAAPKHPVYIS